jgi:hypothetical protein
MELVRADDVWWCLMSSVEAAGVTHFQHLSKLSSICDLQLFQAALDSTCNSLVLSADPPVSDQAFLFEHMSCTNDGQLMLIVYVCVVQISKVSMLSNILDRRCALVDTYARLCKYTIQLRILQLHLVLIFTKIPCQQVCIRTCNLVFLYHNLGLFAGITFSLRLMASELPLMWLHAWSILDKPFSPAGRPCFLGNEHKHAICRLHVFVVHLCILVLLHLVIGP